MRSRDSYVINNVSVKGNDFICASNFHCKINSWANLISKQFKIYGMNSAIMELNTFGLKRLKKFNWKVKMRTLRRWRKREKDSEYSMPKWFIFCPKFAFACKQSLKLWNVAILNLFCCENFLTNPVRQELPWSLWVFASFFFFGTFK